MKIKNHLTKFAVSGSVFAMAGLGLAGCAKNDKPVVEEVKNTTSASSKGHSASDVKSADDAIALLKAGNADYIKGIDTTNISAKTREELVSGQYPYAVVVSCSDSRVPAEEVFNAGLGEIFTIRTAGEALNSTDIGSVEYGVEHAGAKVVVVMGHSGCGAVAAAVNGHASGDIKTIVDQIIPAVNKAKETEKDTKAIASKAVDINVMNQIETLRKNKVLKHLEEEGKVKFVGARYDLSTGAVKFFE